ncbi:MAG: DM13 domain-containing protein [Cyanobacteria bacterium J06621_11]
MTVLNKLQKLGLAAAIAAFAYQPAIQASSQRLSQPSPTAPTVDTLIAAAPEASLSDSLTANTKQLAEGSPFVNAAKAVSGNAQIIEENGQRYLELDAAFSSASGPDLFVLLHRDEVPNSYSPEDYVNLGRIQELEGAQRYAIPADVDLSDLRSAVIWCQEFNVTFGYAVL